MRYWKRTNPDGSTRTVESYSHDLDVEGAIEITKEEFDEFISSLPEPEPEPESAKFERLNPIEGVEPRLTHIEEWLEEHS